MHTTPQNAQHMYFLPEFEMQAQRDSLGCWEEQFYKRSIAECSDPAL